MANFGGFLQALGQAFGGYGQDQQNRFARDQSTQRLGLERRSADDAHTNALLERATNYPLLSADGTSQTPSLPGMDNFPTGRVDVPGYGAVDPFGSVRKSLWVEGLKRRLDTDEKIRESEATGGTRRNTAEAGRAEAETDPTFAGQKAGAEAAARFPWEQRMEGARFGFQNQLQNNRFGFEQGQQGRQQQFDQGQQGRQFQFDADKASRQLAGNFANESQLAYQRQGDGLWSSLWRDRPTVAAPSQRAMPTPQARTASPPPESRPDLASRIQQLKDQGFSKDKARLQLKREGYDLSGTP